MTIEMGERKGVALIIWRVLGTPFRWPAMEAFLQIIWCVFLRLVSFGVHQTKIVSLRNSVLSDNIVSF